MPGYKSATQFFHDGNVHRWISTLAAAERVTIYAGAGLTIDKTGLGWAELIRQALSDNSLENYIDHHGADLVATNLAPIEAATIAEHYYAMLFEEVGGGRTRLLQALQGLLYPGSYWQAGRLTANVLNFATSLAGTDVDVKIVTTNYETHIEDQYLTLAEAAAKVGDRAFPGLRVRILDRDLHRHGPDNAVGDIELTYLHGRIPNHGRIDGEVALSEHDYYRLRGPVSETLQDAFDHRAVVIAGASLTDPPLLAALEQNASENDGQRVALTPLPAYAFHKNDNVSHGDIDVLKTHLESRMQEFGVELLFPDFFYQVAQFFDETRIARVLTPDDHYQLGDGSIRYGGRLMEWWHHWSESHLSISNAAARAHAAVKLALDQVLASLPLRAGVRGTEAEPIRMDVWVRWSPTGDSRCLALWAHSAGPNVSAHMPEIVELDSSSDLQAMRAFVHGRPIHVLGAVGRHFSSVSHLAVPIHYDGGITTVPVGVVVVSSPWGKTDTRLSGASAVAMNSIIDGMRAAGINLLGREQLPEVDPPTIS